jgi:hypothetical protein
MIPEPVPPARLSVGFSNGRLAEENDRLRREKVALLDENARLRRELGAYRAAMAEVAEQIADPRDRLVAVVKFLQAAARDLSEGATDDDPVPASPRGGVEIWREV